VFSPKYRGKLLVGDVGMVAEGIIRKTCKELDIEVIDMAVNPDHVHLFIKYPPKYSGLGTKSPYIYQYVNQCDGKCYCDLV